MKQQIALRIELDLLEEVRRCAADENRTVTNFIETILKREVRRTACADLSVKNPSRASTQPSSVPRPSKRRSLSKQA